VLSLLLGGTAARAQQLTIWHDLGDNGTKWFVAASEEFAKTHPGVTVRAISYPTDQWFGRCIGAINTNTAPDLIYNNYERVIRVAAQTHKIEDMKPILAAIADKAFLSPDDLRVATYAGHMIILPVQRELARQGGREFPAHLGRHAARRQEVPDGTSRWRHRAGVCLRAGSRQPA
jgi:multiple sugar transport system substrate-binding protein